jgi:hypothetical protein
MIRAARPDGFRKAPTMPFRTKKVIIELEAAKDLPEYRNFRFRNLGTLDWKEQYVVDAGELGAAAAILVVIFAAALGMVDIGPDLGRRLIFLLTFGFAVFGLGAGSLTMVSILPKTMISKAGDTSYARLIASTFLMSTVILLVTFAWATDCSPFQSLAEMPVSAVALTLLALACHSAIIGAVYGHERRRREGRWAASVRRHLVG